ncbi:MAG: bifunctional phosphopantothenoylcysteine decarboxylase/phosphopantothenate--cysteine ligase CoaBC [Pseudomonadales bacterium]|nr:bifunctional phosphopantothenoylcysteine decarboxylase/phosphopantothenate--cysteine ligase CoaBC [Pseudomonadales bacterium]NIX07619.1 bifunctional phosphopantothenoylcysteine decarboxylase/phosphopantothenate--cysteine ligase CoaBC [Pseudomonadales bacterium]
MTQSDQPAPGNLEGRNILLGVSGGIAAYKAPILVRLLRQAGADVQVVLTRSANQFVTATTLQAVSGRPIRDDLWDAAAEAAMGHIELARWADAVLIAPATADLISRLANGRADDLLTTLVLATRAPVLVAPAMNNAMWDHPANQRNVGTLADRGVHVLGPDSGEQACGEFGPGRMREPADLVSDLDASFQANDDLLAGKTVLVTAGPTREAIDPVRYVTNHSSGKQGYAMAAAARAAGARVILISGPVSLPTPIGVRRIDVTSAAEMHEAVMAHATACDVFIGVAAVADYRPDRTHDQKIKKSDQGPGAPGLSLSLVENPDIIRSVSSLEHGPFIVGFAAETHDALRHAREKRARKGMDLIVVNDVSDSSIGFNSDQNAATVIWESGEFSIARQSKDLVARAVIDLVAAQISDALADANPERIAK